MLETIQMYADRTICVSNIWNDLTVCKQMFNVK